MKGIYKYQLEVKEEQELNITGLPEYLSIQMQAGRIVFWAYVDCDEEERPITFKIVGTGMPFEDRPNWFYLGTVQHNGYVWHVFSKLN